MWQWSLVQNRPEDGLLFFWTPLRSPCGGVIGQLAYNYNGDIFTCDEGRMLAETGDLSFKLGDVFHSTFSQIFESSVCKLVCTASCLESIPCCEQCVYSPYCVYAQFVIMLKIRNYSRIHLIAISAKFIKEYSIYYSEKYLKTTVL